MKCLRPPIFFGILLVSLFGLFGDVNLVVRVDSDSLAGDTEVGISQALAGTRRDRASAENRQDCEDYCRRTPDCIRCSTLADCGPGQKDIKSWTGYGDNWHACAARESRSEASARNRQSCQDYCNKTSACVKCSELPDCGPDYKDIKSWTGHGDNWYACAARESRREASARNRQSCQDYCNKTSACVKCSELPDCGPDYKDIKSWTGHGDNWYACAKRLTRREASASHKQECESWCKKNKDCHKCIEKVGCGKGYNNIKSWTGYGDNWYACQRTGSINLIWPSTNVAKAEHRMLLVSMGGFYGYKDRDGFEWFCDDYFSGRKANPKILCISSWGNISTRSETLSNNIADMASEIQNKSGKRPQIILVGKSMGGCKLHHAATGIKDAKDGKLKNRTVDLFIGADLSCGSQRHFEKGERDALWFTNNVKKLLVFYQNKEGESMTGHRGIYVDHKFDPDIHINVAKHGLDVKMERRARQNPPNGLCGDVTHLDLDDCTPLLHGIRQMILNRVR